MRYAALLIGLMFTVPLCGADHWPSWRGANANGIAPESANPPVKWDQNTNIKWKVEMIGKGSATPIIWDDQLFLVTASKTDRVAKPDELPKIDRSRQTRTDPPKHFYRFEVISYNRHTGEVNWRQVANEAVPHEGHHITHSYAGGSPTTDGKRLYVSFGSFGIYAYDLQGQLLWKRDLGLIHSRLGWGEAVTPVIHDDSLVLNWDQESGSKLIVLNSETGATRWEVPRDERTTWNVPRVVEHDGRVQVIVNGTNRVRSYDLADGKLIWSVDGMTVNPIPSPITENGIAYIMSGYRGTAAVAVSLDGDGDLSGKEIRWRYNEGTPYVPSPLLHKGLLYFTKGNTQLLTILDAKTGKPLLKEERLPSLNQIYASPMVANDRIYFVDRQGTTAVLKAGPEMEVLSVNRLDDTIDASPVAVGKTLYLRGEKYLYAIEEK
jgi:outer membrane protein assembly factor BamB